MGRTPLRPVSSPSTGRSWTGAPQPVAVAEIAAELDLPVSVTKILVADLVALGTVTVNAPLAVAPGTGGGIDMTLLQEVRDGLARL